VRREKIAERQRFADDLARRDALRGTAPLKPRKKEFRPHKRLRLSPAGEIRALSRLLHRHAPEAAGLWALTERSISMTEVANIEIIEAFVRLGDDASINLDEDTSRAIYALAWAKFEKALVNANALYNETPEDQVDQFNRVKRLLWEAVDLKSAAEVLYHLTAMPDELIEDDNA
jgi:hypothetical protein